MDIGRYLKQQREQALLTQQELADMIGCNQTVISRLETGKLDNPTLATMDRIAEGLGKHFVWAFQ